MHKYTLRAKCPVFECKVRWYIYLAKWFHEVVCKANTGDARTTRVGLLGYWQKHNKAFCCCRSPEVSTWSRDEEPHSGKIWNVVSVAISVCGSHNLHTKFELTSETHKHVLLWTSLTFITDSEQDSNHDWNAKMLARVKPIRTATFRYFFLFIAKSLTS
jgi:hypothetical protein